MKIEVNLEKKHLFSVVAVLIIVLGGFGAYALWDNSKTLWHSGSDVKITISGQDYSLQEAIGAGLFNGSSTVISGANNIASGSYLGDNAVSRTINVGFKPIAVWVGVAQQIPSGDGVHSNTISFRTADYPIGYSVAGNSLVSGRLTEFTDSGFKVGSWMNNQSLNFSWVAVGVGGSTNPPSLGVCKTICLNPYSGTCDANLNPTNGVIGFYDCNSVFPGYVQVGTEQSWNGASFFISRVKCCALT